MERARKVALVAHCLLNVNARVAGLARYAGVHPVIAELASRGYGIVQLPCPEIGGGLDRAPQPFERYDTPGYRALCDSLADTAADTIAEYAAAGCDTRLVVGVDGSPSCGVALTNVSAAEGGTQRAPGCGVFVCSLRERLPSPGTVFVAVDGRDEDLGVARVIAAIEGR
jgi:predicted secreted protein